MGIEEQYADIQKVAKAEQEKLTKLIQNPEYQKLGAAGKHFEPITKEIIDPETGRVIQKFTIDFKKMGNTIKTSLTQIGAPAKAFGNQMRNAARRVVQWGFASGAIYGTIRAFRNLVQVVTEVQTKVANLMKVMDTSITNFEEMQNAASGMGKEFGIAIEDVLEGMVVYAQQGLKVNEIMDRTRSTMLAVNVTTLSSTEATEALTAAHKVFGSAMSNSTGFVDAWAAVAAKHAITAKDLAMAVQRSGAAAKTAGVSFEDFMGITTAIGAVTRQTGKEIATGTKFMFRAMRRPTAQKTLLGLGIQSQTGGGELKPAVDILGELAGRWGKLSRAQQLNTAQAMAGIRHYNQFIVLMENWREVINASADAQNSQGFAVRKNAIAVQTFAKQMQSLREHVKGVALDIGKLMLPGLTGITKLAKGAVAVLDLLPDSLKQLGVIGAASMITIHKGADMFVDTLDAIKGHGGDAQSSMKSLFQDRGLVRGAAALGKKGFGALFGGMGAAMRGKGEAAGERFGIIARGMLTAQKAASGLAKAFMGLSRAGKLLAGTTVVGLIASLGMLAYAYFDTAKSGKELEDELFDQIGRAKE
jgi:TP901 family phage tail tape measure protein